MYGGGNQSSKNRVANKLFFSSIHLKLFYWQNTKINECKFASALNSNRMECKQNKKNEWKIEANEIHVFSLVDFRIDRRMIKHRTKKSE